MNGLRDITSDLYTGGSGSTAGSGFSGGGQTAGAGFGVNVGGETFRVQLAISGIVLTALVVLLLLHRHGNRFSVKV